MSETSGRECQGGVFSRQSPEVENSLTLAHCQLASIRSALNIGPEESFSGLRRLLIDNKVVHVGIDSNHSDHMAVTIAPMVARGEQSWVIHTQDLSGGHSLWQVQEYDEACRPLGVLSLDDEQQALIQANNLRTALFYFADNLRTPHG